MGAKGAKSSCDLLKQASGNLNRDVLKQALVRVTGGLSL